MFTLAHASTLIKTGQIRVWPGLISRSLGHLGQWCWPSSTLVASSYKIFKAKMALTHPLLYPSMWICPLASKTEALHLAVGLEAYFLMTWTVNTVSPFSPLSGTHNVLCNQGHTLLWYQWQVPYNETGKL